MLFLKFCDIYLQPYIQWSQFHNSCPTLPKDLLPKLPLQDVCADFIVHVEPTQFSVSLRHFGVFQQRFLSTNKKFMKIFRCWTLDSLRYSIGLRRPVRFDNCHEILLRRPPTICETFVVRALCHSGCIIFHHTASAKILVCNCSYELTYFTLREMM